MNRIDIVTEFREDRDEAVRQVLFQFDLHRLTGVSANGRSSWADAAAKAMGRLNVFFREGGEVGENLRCCRAFGEAGEHSLQRDARTLQDGFATDDLRVTAIWSW